MRLLSQYLRFVIIAVVIIALTACGPEPRSGGGGDENNAANNAANNGGNNAVNNNPFNNSDNNQGNNANNGGNGGNAGNNQANNGGNNTANNANNGGNAGNNQANNGGNGGNNSICEPGEQRCTSERVQAVCSNDGTAWEEVSCEEGFVCVEATGACQEIVCEPGANASCSDASTLVVCNDTGTGYDETPCPDDLQCEFIEEQFQCTDQICEPEALRCSSESTTEVCNAEGTAWEEGVQCPSGTLCDAGECLTLCEINSKISSFLGCEYWSIDLDNIEGGTNAAHAVVVSNPFPDVTAELTFYDDQGEEIDVSQWDLTVPPGGQRIIRFEGNYTNNTTNESLINTNYVDGTMLGDQSYRLVTSVPTTVHQFNPLVDRNVYTNDASLLLPTNAVGEEYLVMSWKHRTRTPTLRGFVTVLAFSDEPTTVTVTPTADVVGGTNRVTDAPITAIPSGQSREFTLEAGQFINIESDGQAGADLTGTQVTASEPVVVFGGHECANVPTEDDDACDHLEQQMFPVAAWGQHYVLSAFEPRTDDDGQVFRILASQDDTQITTTPPQPNANDVTLQRGEYLEFTSDQHFQVDATAPILVGQYIRGQDAPGGGNSGDPAFTLAVPAEQWRRDYIVLTPQAYNEDYLNVIAISGAEVNLDGEPLTGWTDLNNGEYRVARLSVEDGTHTLVSEGQFTVIAYGYDGHVSYAYPGGLNLEAINR